MLLICGSTDDILVQELMSQAQRADMTTGLLGESTLFASCPFALSRRGESVHGFIVLGEQRVSLDDLEGVFLRLPRVWWPSANFDLADQLFVYHETLASWFAVLDSLSCPVVNRFGLGWWLQDLTYVLALRTGLARALGVPISEPEERQPQAGGLQYWPRAPAEGVVSAYRSGGVTLPRQESHDLLTHLAASEEPLSRWEREYGIELSRIDFDRRNGLHLRWVEVSPQVNNEPAHLVQGIATAALRRVFTGHKAGA